MYEHFCQYGGAVDTVAEVKKVVDAVQAKMKDEFDEKYVAEISAIPELKEQYDILVKNMADIGMIALPIATDPIQLLDLLNNSIDTILNVKSLIDGNLRSYKNAQESLKLTSEMIKNGTLPTPPPESTPAPNINTPPPKVLQTSDWLKYVIIFMILFLIILIIVFVFMG